MLFTPRPNVSLILEESNARTLETPCPRRLSYNTVLCETLRVRDHNFFVEIKLMDMTIKE